MKKLFVATIVALIVAMILSNNVFGAEIENQKWHIGFGYESQLTDLTIQSQNSSYGSAVSETYTFKAPTNAGFIDFGINPTKNLEWNFRYSKSAEAEVFNGHYYGSYNPEFGIGINDGQSKPSHNGLISGISDSKLVVTNRFSGTSKVTYKTEGWRSELVYQIPYNPSKDQVRFKIIGGTYMSRGVAMTSIASANSSTAEGFILFDSKYNATDVVYVPPVEVDHTEPIYKIVMPNNSNDDPASHWLFDPHGTRTDTSTYYVRINKIFRDIFGCERVVGSYYVPVEVAIKEETSGNLSLTRKPVTINGKPEKYYDPTTGQTYDIEHKAETNIYIDITGINGDSASLITMREEMKLRGDYIGISAEYDIVKNLWLEITGRKVFNGYAKSIVNINGIEDVARDDDPNILMLDASLKAKFVEGVTMKFGYQKTFVDYTLRGAKFSDESSAISLVLDWQW